MKKPVVLVGVGEMGGVFVRGFLKAGYPVYPVGRSTDTHELAKDLPNPEAVVVAVAEADLDQTLSTLPDVWKSQLVLLQNELLPSSWQKHNIPNPTVISVWFEKKPGRDVKVIIPSPVYGPKAHLLYEALQALKIPCDVLQTEDDLLCALLVKNLFILTINISGLKVGGSVGALWADNEDLARAVANDVLDIQFHMAGKSFDREVLIQQMLKAINSNPDHQCLGRTAAARLERAIRYADQNGLNVLTLKYIADSKAQG